jgi:hypothetical protein
MSGDVPNDLFATRSVGSELDGVTMILSADTTKGYSLIYDTNTPEIAVYAEVLSLPDDFNLVPIPKGSPTRSILMSCNTLVLGSSSSSSITINVNGIKGEDDKGGKGTSGGRIVLSVEKLAYDQLGHLGEDGKPVGIYLNAYGAEGGTGAQGIGEGKPGGDGGDGGDGGTYVKRRSRSAFSNH